MCGNYSRSETIQGRKLYEEIRYIISVLASVRCTKMKIQLQKGLDPNVLSTMTKDKWDAFAMDKAISVSFPAFLFTLGVWLYVPIFLQYYNYYSCSFVTPT